MLRLSKKNTPAYFRRLVVCLLVMSLAVANSLVFIVSPLFADEDDLTFSQAFPDPGFCSFTLDFLGGEKTASSIFTDEDKAFLAEATVLDVSAQGIVSLEGIEYYLNVQELHGNNNQLTSIDLSALSSLRWLDLNQNNLTSLDLSSLPNLQFVTCNTNQLSEINVYGLSQLESLGCGTNALTTLDLSNTPSLQGLWCDNNQLSELGLSNVSNLSWLSCFSNELSELDLSNLPELQYLLCYENQLSQLSLDHNPKLNGLWCNNNLLASLDVSRNFQLDLLYCYNNLFVSPYNIVGWQDIGLQINSTDDQDSGSMRYYDQLVTQSTEITFRQAFPDAVFREYVLSTYLAESSADSIVTEADKAVLSEVKDLNTSYRNISSLTGIEYFTSLEALHVTGNNLSALNVSDNPHLLVLNCQYNHLQRLTVDKASELTELRCYSNELGFIDLSQNTELAILIVSINNLTGLDVSNNTSLVDLQCSQNLITSLDLSNNPNLEYLECWDNPLGSLDLSNNTELLYLVSGNNGLNELDLTANTKLVFLECWENSLESIDLRSNPDLTYLHCGGNLINAIDLSHNTALEQARLSDNNLQSLDLTNNSKLRILYCSFNQLAAIDLSHNPLLEELYCTNNLIGSIDVRDNPKLVLLSCGENQLLGLNVSQNPDLAFLWCSDNALQNLDISQNPKLQQVYCQRNDLDILDVTNNTQIDWLFCYSNNLTELDVSNCLAMRRLYCYDNSLTVLDVTQNTALEQLRCEDNHLTLLDVRQNTSLQLLYCSGNYLTSPDQVIGWEALGLQINSEEVTESGTFRYYMQSAAPLIDLGQTTIVVASPKAGELAQTTIGSGEGYYGSITWQNVTNDTVHTGAFESGYAYEARVSLTSTDSYQWPTTPPLVYVGGQLIENTSVVGTGSGNVLTFAIAYPVLEAQLVFYPTIQSFSTFTGIGSRMAIIDAPFDEFVELSLNGQTVDPAYYVVSDGATTILLSQAYLEGLSNGDYLFRVEFENGYAELTLKVDVTANNGSSVSPPHDQIPSTGDVAVPFVIWAVISAMAGTLLLLVYLYSEKAYRAATSFGLR
ncbi:MAG: hypothetical protein FWH40_06495 [Coriobacteriia bacterium]|nr:hypothetical protein [Coriobacteriia bacterium]